VSIKCAEPEIAVYARFPCLPGASAFQNEMNAIQYEVIQVHSSPPKAASRTEFQGKWMATFQFERFSKERWSRRKYHEIKLWLVGIEWRAAQDSRSIADDLCG